MKINQHARKFWVIGHVTSVLATLVLVSAAFLMVCHLGHDWGQIDRQPAVPMPAIGDWFAPR